ncbi:BREX-3 system P-loop-containing protein BrxF [Bradyrhizobium vignae]|uniref:BREX-3 system P-loop-containing protein BrxF n=1 Tax=Bradyrhizobium vignae TaxID=1549949 RepID=UPI00100B7337|nr:BREX-3 system P-loop-containing protein BrxF [Bradyrhizobium vignae]RXH05816.1 BREX-3 system P-loop-containing protein BrxF [Bradyrhizobium vignae]
MPTSIQNRIKQSLGQAENLYHRLVLLVGKSGSGKTAALRIVAGELGTDVINVNLALSAKLIELTERQRTLHLSTLFGGVIEEAGTVALLDNIEILFDHGLHQDPLRLLQSVSRNRCVVASWNGAVTGSKLTYAESGHPEYRSYDAADALIVNMNESSGLDAQERQRA